MSNLYYLDLPDAVKANVDKAPNTVRPRIKKILSNLRTDPRPPNAKQLRDMPNGYRIVIDSYRIYYLIDDEQMIVNVLRIGQKHGPEFYEGPEIYQN